MTREDNIIVPRWFLENVENTLRIQNNINLDKETGETCQDRNVRQSLNGLRKLLKEEKLTGRERFEKLQPSMFQAKQGHNVEGVVSSIERKGKRVPCVCMATEILLPDSFKPGDRIMIQVRKYEKDSI